MIINLPPIWNSCYYSLSAVSSLDENSIFGNFSFCKFYLKVFLVTHVLKKSLKKFSKLLMILLNFSIQKIKNRLGFYLKIGDYEDLYIPELHFYFLAYPIREQGLVTE